MADPEILSDDPLRDRYEEIKEREEREAARTILTHGLHVLFKVAVAAVFVMALFYGMRWAYRFGYSIFTTPIGEELVQNGLSGSSAVFAVQARIYGYEILPGTYTLNTSQTIYQMLRIMSTPPEQ